MLSHTTRKNSDSLRSCSELRAMYFSRSVGRLRRFVSTRSTCCSIESTCAGKNPRNPNASRSASVNAVPLLRSGSRNNAMPLGDSEGNELGFARTDTLMHFLPSIFPSRMIDCLQHLPNRSRKRSWRSRLEQNFLALAPLGPSRTLQCGRSYRAVAFLDFIVSHERARGAVIDHRALVQHVSAVRDVERQIDVLLDQEHRGPLGLHRTEQREHFVDQHRHDAF